MVVVVGCLSFVKDKNSKAIHNGLLHHLPSRLAVYRLSKIRIRKQFTTAQIGSSGNSGCLSFVKDKNSKAIHNDKVGVKYSKGLFIVCQR